MHYYQFDISAWAIHTSHLTIEEEGVYRRLLDYYYDTELPIPEETKSVIRRLRLVNHEDIVASILAEFFDLEDDGWHNHRADLVINDYRKKSEKARENGKKGGRPKQNQGLETELVILANPEEATSQANYKLLTKNYELETNNITYPSDSAPLKELVELFNEMFPELPKVKTLTDKRKTALRRRWLENTKIQSVDRWRDFFEFIRKSDFLMGRTNPNPWNGFCFDWLINQGNFTKIIEGNYHK